MNPSRDRGSRTAMLPRRLSELPGTPDAVVVAVPAASVPEVIDEAGRLGCGGAVVYAAGFAEAPGGRELQDELVAAATRHDAAGLRAERQRDRRASRSASRCGATRSSRREPGHVALDLPERQPRRQRALRSPRPAPAHGRLVRKPGGARGGGLPPRPRARTRACARWRSTSRTTATARSSARRSRRAPTRGSGSRCSRSARRRRAPSAAAAHTGAVAGDQRVFAGADRGGGAALAADPHDLLELATALAARGPRRRERRRPAGWR